ncbi:MAG: tetratricopeptide repeat protein [Acidobacteriota bacterium]
MKREFILWIVIGLMVFASASLLATQGMGQGVIVGTVIDEGGKPIMGAKIRAYIKESDEEFITTTNDKGRFRFSRLGTGLFEFTAVAPGYQPLMITQQISQAARNPDLEFILKKLTGEMIAEADPNYPLIKEGNELFQQRRYDEAIEKFQQVVNSAPEYYRFYVNLGNCYKEKGDYQKAIDNYMKVLEQEPEQTAALLNIGESYVLMDKTEEAIIYFEKVIAQNPTDPVIFYNLGETYAIAGNHEKALESYQKAAELKPEWETPYLKMGYSFVALERKDEAIKAFEKFLELAPDSPDAPLVKQFLEQLRKEN